MKQELSILIPIYNNDCTEQVKILSSQAEAISGLRYEIILADDGSDNPQFITQNSQLSTLPHVRFIPREQNVGRAAIRNFLCSEARYAWLLFMDGDMGIPSESFVRQWLEADVEQVGYGGYIIGESAKGNLRYRYESQCEAMHTAEERRKRPFLHFHTCNFLIRKDLMEAHPFDERFRKYGYEDVFFGKQLRKAGVVISHPDNPAGFFKYEDNAHFVSKTEEGLRTLYEFRGDLRGYSQMLTFVESIHLGIVRWAIRMWHRLFGKLERSNLYGPHPNLTVFKLYKLGYFLTLKNQQQ
ncbi:MAG: glycosyltransferase [Prevotella sp.]|nr:glycosyltransferase [Prevotella sp.]